MKKPIDFVREHPEVFDPIRSGFTRNLNIHILNEFEALYRANYDPQFVLVKWCKSCVFETMQRFMLLAELEAIAEKPKRKKK